MTKHIEPWAAVSPEGEPIWQTVSKTDGDAWDALCNYAHAEGIQLGTDLVAAGWIVRQVEIRVKEQG